MLKDLKIKLKKKEKRDNFQRPKNEKRPSAPRLGIHFIEPREKVQVSVNIGVYKFIVK